MNKLLIALGLIGFCQAYWYDWKITVSGKRIFSPITAMTSSKIFGIGKLGNLWEIYYNNGWSLVFHGNQHTLEKVKPCVLSGKVFVISTSGELYELYHLGSWSWVPHGKPSGSVSVGSSSGCASISLGTHRVFVVGSDSQLHERFYDNGQWWWRSHQHLPSTHIVSIDTAGLNVYAVDTHGVLYEKRFNPFNPSGVSQWSLKRNDVVQVSGPNAMGGRIYITTKNNKICEYDAAIFLFNCFTFNEFSSAPLPIRISKSIPIVECPGLTSGRYLAVHSAEWNKYNRLHIIRFTGSATGFPSKAVVHHRTSKDFQGAPELINNGNCLKAFSLENDGTILDTAWH